ncbi:hypothetical protein [Ureibacillus sp. FSL K6-0786]|uniref:hypothetical protein n=1 Tax=Ureibacillus sp. FSL K6-0786 TaxID=2954607 RepID=UPI0030DB7660
MPVVVAQVIGYSKKMDVYYPRLGVFVFSLKSRKNKTENSDIIYATVVRKDEFEIFKRFDLEFGPFTNDEGKDQFKGKTVTFTLPR